MDVRHGRYDGDLQMLVEPPREPDMARVTFLRWLVERRRIEHGPSGRPCGDLASHLAVADAEAVELEAA